MQLTGSPGVMKMKGLALILIICFASIALADDFKTIDGKEYKNVTVSRVEPDGIVLITKSGISKIYFTELPKEVRARFNYDPEKAAAYSAEQNANLELLGKQQEEARQKLTKERARYWSEHPTPKPRRIFSNGMELAPSEIDQLNLTEIHKNMNGEMVSGIAADGVTVGQG